MTFQEIINTVLTVAGPIGGAIVWIVAERRKNSKEKKQDQQNEAERERSYSERLTNRLKSAEQTIERITIELTDERLKHGKYTVPADVLRDLIDNDPGISWVKRRMGKLDYVMIRCSTGYGRDILEGPAESYDGKRDHEFWDKESADHFADNDELVYKTQEGHHFVEITPKGKFVGRKFPVRLNDGADYIVGIGTFEKNLM